MITNSNRLSVLNTHWQNRSLSSVTSDAATFHSAHAHMELSHLDTDLASTPRPRSPRLIPASSNIDSTKVEATSMARQDSGFSDGIRSTSSSRRTSTSSIQRNSKRTPHTSTRPNTKRAPRSSPTTSQTQTRTSISSKRPLLSTRHTTPYPPTNSTPYQFFQFPPPTLDDSTTTPPPSQPTELAAPPPLPTTCQYWTSDSTRRLEYAAIDAASRGFRGFMIKLVPDCILPPKARRTKFHKEDDADSDAGSVRRYRIPLPEEKVCPFGSKVRVAGEGSAARPGLLKRLTSFGRKESL